MLRLLGSLFDRLEESNKEYKSNVFIKEMIDDLSLKLIRMFQQIDTTSDFGDKLNNLLLFTVLNIASRKEENTEKQLARIFDKSSFIGRKIMIQLNDNRHKLEWVLKFFICVISAIEDADLIKAIIRQVLLLVYRTYTNSQLNKTDARDLSVEIIELLQKKLEKE